MDNTYNEKVRHASILDTKELPSFLAGNPADNCPSDVPIDDVMQDTGSSARAQSVQGPSGKSAGQFSGSASFPDSSEHAAAFAPIITQSAKMLSVFSYLTAVIKTRRPVCIFGETGAGKGMVADTIHRISGLKGNYVRVNVAGLDDTMFSDTLFGHKKGAYTGADSDRRGLVSRASRGMILLDEIGDLSEHSQVKLLSLLEEQRYYALGSDVAESTDAMIIASTNVNLEEQMARGKFRKDLYYRLCTHGVRIPSLRERIEDIPLLLDHFIEQASRSLLKKRPSYPKELLTILSNYHFPGNVRELQAMVYDALAQHTSGMLSTHPFMAFIERTRSGCHPGAVHPDAVIHSLARTAGRLPTLKETEAYLIAEAMERSRGNQGIAASLLGLKRQTLNKRLRKSEKTA